MNDTQPRAVACGRRVRTVSQKVFHSRVDETLANEQELQKLVLEAVNNNVWWPGDVLLVDASVPQPVAGKLLEWLQTLGVRKSDLVDAGTLHACEGSWFHEDSGAFANNFFSVMWLEETDAWDLLFPNTGLRIPLHKGTVVLFDPAHVHGVVARGASVFEAEAMGEHGVQAFASLNFKTSPRMMQLFDSRWHVPGEPAFDTGWNKNPFSVDPKTGRMVGGPKQACQR